MTYDYPQEIVLPTEAGDASAVKASRSTSWTIGYPWGDDRFYGTRTEVLARMKREIADREGTCV